jgi:large exoprotein involved in heme utilization and adhesion
LAGLKGGDINITTESLSLENSSVFFTATFGQADTGNINIKISDTATLRSASFVGIRTGALPYL